MKKKKEMKQWLAKAYEQTLEIGTQLEELKRTQKPSEVRELQAQIHSLEYEIKRYKDIELAAAMNMEQIVKAAGAGINGERYYKVVDQVKALRDFYDENKDRLIDQQTRVDELEKHIREVLENNDPLKALMKQIMEAAGPHPDTNSYDILEHVRTLRAFYDRSKSKNKKLI